MAFTPDTLAVIVQPIGGEGIRFFSYRTDDPAGTVMGTGYFTGVKSFACDSADLIFVTPAAGDDEGYVLSIDVDAAGNGTGKLSAREVYPTMFGARGGGVADDTIPLDIMFAAAAALNVPIKIDGVYRRKSQWSPAAGTDIGPASLDAKIIFELSTNSSCCLIQSSNVTFRKGLTIELDYKGSMNGPFGTIFTVGRDAYPTTAPAVISDVTISCTTRRTAGTAGNNISVLGNVERIKVDALVYGGGPPVTIGPTTYESNGFIAHWGAHSSLTTILTNSYHPRNIDIDGLEVVNAGAPVTLSSVYNVTGHFTGTNCSAAFNNLPGDNGADYAEAAHKPLVGSGINVSGYVTGCLPNKPVYMTSMGNSPFDGKLHTVAWRDLNVQLYVRLGTPSTTEQVCDIENMVGAGRFSIELENVGDGPGFALERVVGSFVFEDCASDSTKQGAIVVRCRGVSFINPRMKRARMLGSVTTTTGIEAYGQKIAGALSAGIAAGATALPLTAAFGQRCMPGDVIHVTTGGRQRACYVTEPTTTTATSIPIKPTHFSASSADVVNLRTDISDFEVKGGTIAGHYYGIGINRGLGVSFMMEGFSIQGVDFYEIGNQSLALFQARQFTVKENREVDCGVGRVISGSLTTRFANFDTCTTGRIRDNFVNSDASPNVYYAFVNNAACTDLQITGNGIGALASGGAAFSAANQAGNTYASNFFLDGSAATP